MSKIYTIADQNDVIDLQNHLMKPGVKCFKAFFHKDELVLKCTNDNTFVVLKDVQEPFKYLLEATKPKYDPLIFGKNQIERIVGLEVLDDQILMFKEMEDGRVEQFAQPNRFWILSRYPINNDTYFRLLNGENHYQWIKQYESYDEFLDDRKSFFRYDIYSIYDPKEQAMVRNGITYFKGMKINDVSVLSFDIETTTLKHNENSKVLLISNTFEKNGKIERKLFAYDDYLSEAEMYIEWVKWVQEKNPAIILGHNIYMFDLPYLKFCADKLGVELNLGRDKSPIRFNSYKSKFRRDGSQFYEFNKVRVFGREVIDTMFLAYKYDVGRKYESYALKQIIKQEGLEIEDRVFYDANKIKDNYKNPTEWCKIKKYAIHDADDALNLYKLFAPTFFYLSQIVSKTFQEICCSASGSQLNNILVRSYLQDNFAIPKATDTKEYHGGISIGKPGIYKNVFKIDVNSEYPSIMLEYKVYDQKKDPKAHFLKIVEYFFNKKTEYKQKFKETKDTFYQNMEATTKVLVNSAYGLLGSVGLNFNSPFNAAFVTEKGREIIKKAIYWATGDKIEVKIEKDIENEETENDG